MQVHVTEKSPEFTPVVVQLTLTTPEELKGFTTFCDYIPIGNAAKAVGFNLFSIWNALPNRKITSRTWHTDSAPITEVFVKQFGQHGTNGVKAKPEVASETPTLTFKYAIPGKTGKIYISDGREFSYRIASCGGTIYITTLVGDPIATVQTVKRGAYKLTSQDFERIEAVLTKIKY